MPLPVPWAPWHSASKISLKLHQRQELAETLDEDYEALDETEDEWSEPETPPTPEQLSSVAEEIAELRAFQHQAATIRDNAKGQALLQALGKAFSELKRLGANQKALIFTESKRTQDLLAGVAGAKPLRGTNRAV